MGKKYILDDKICKEFTLIDIATVEYGNKFDKNKMSRINPSINFVSRTATNNGVSDFVDNNGTIPYKKGLITLALGGSIGSCFLQEQPFYTGQNVGVIDLGDIDYHAKIYFTEALGYKCKKSFNAFGNEINKHLKTDLSVSLPIKQDGNGDPVIDIENKYHQKGYVPDWDFMQKYIEELEKERIEELEKYLLATELNDYQLTDEDIDVLSRSGFGHQEEPNCENVVKIYEEFKVSDLFESSNGDTDLQKSHINGIGYNIISSGRDNNGVIGKTDIKAKIFNADTITIDMFGNCFYRDEQYKMVTHARVFSLSPLFEGLNNLNGQYIVSLFKYLPSAYNYSNMCSWKKIKDDTLSLPIQTDKDNNPLIDTERKYHPDGYIPDWDFMEKYIRAIEKVVIADVVKYKDEVIAKTKTTVG